MVAAVKGLHWRTSLEIHKLLKDNEDFCITYNDGEEGAEPEKVKTFPFGFCFFVVFVCFGSEVLIFELLNSDRCRETGGDVASSPLVSVHIF